MTTDTHPQFLANLRKSARAVDLVAAQSKRWRGEKRRDSRYDNEQDFYLCPIELVKWGRLRGE